MAMTYGKQVTEKGETENKQEVLVKGIIDVFNEMVGRKAFFSLYDLPRKVRKNGTREQIWECLIQLKNERLKPESVMPSKNFAEISVMKELGALTEVDSSDSILSRTN